MTQALTLALFLLVSGTFGFPIFYRRAHAQLHTNFIVTFGEVLMKMKKRSEQTHSDFTKSTV